MQESLHEIFLVHHGFLENTTITMIHKIDDKYYKIRENCWMRALKMLASDGFKDCVWSNIIYTIYYKYIKGFSYLVGNTLALEWN